MSNKGAIPDLYISPLGESPRYNLRITVLHPETFKDAVRVVVDIWFGTRHVGDAPATSATFDVRMPKSFQLDYPNGGWINELRSTLIQNLQMAASVNVGNLENLIKNILHGMHIPLLQTIQPGTNRWVVPLHMNFLQVCCAFSAKNVYQIRLKLQLIDSTTCWEFVIKDLASIDRGLARGVPGMEERNELQLLLWNVSTRPTETAFEVDCVDLFSSQSACLAVIFNPPPSADAASITSNAGFSNYHVAQAWPGYVWIAWRKTSINVNVFEEDDVTTNGVLMDYPTNLLSDMD